MGTMIKEKCYLYGSCKCQTAGCVVLPDEGCPVYRYFKDLILKDYENQLKAEREKIAEDVAVKMDYMGSCLNEKNIILGIITGKRETTDNLCSTCKAESCVSNGTAISKANYEARLKADMVNILKELKKEIIKLPFPQREPEYMQGYSYCQLNILEYVIQEKIDKLKENK